MLWCIVCLLGSYAVLKVSIEIAYTFLVYHILPSKLTKEDGAWAVVTGASRGIGKSFAYALAQKGFNIVLIARSENTLKEISYDLEARFTIQTRVLGLDLSELYRNQPMKQEIQALFSNLKCQLLVANAGIGYLKLFKDLSLKEIDEMFFLNTHPHIYFSKLFLQEHPEIQKHLIHVSSVGAVNITPTASIYGATKAFSDILARYQSYESQTNILSVRPSFTDTEMIKDIHSYSLLASPDDIVYYSLKCVGWKNACKGTWKHVLSSYGWDIMPRILLARGILREFKKYYY